MAKPKTKCANCGDMFTMPVHAVFERQKKNWCAGCWQQRFKNLRTRSDGSEYWADGKPPGHGQAPKGYAGRPDYNRE